MRLKMNCNKCNSILEIDEIYVITKMLEKGKDLPKVCTECLEEWANDWDEKRMDCIGQNGNDGLHYEH